jgi:hypothetical protein
MIPVLLCVSTRAYKENVICIDLRRRLFYRDGQALQFPAPDERHIYFKIIVRLFLQRSGFVTFKDMADYVYDCEDGGPLDPQNAIATAIRTFRVRLAKTVGARIVSGGAKGLKVVW